MKFALSLCLAALAFTPVHAQIFRPDSGRDGGGRSGRVENRQGGNDRRTSVHVGVTAGHGSWSHGHHRHHSPSYVYRSHGAGHGFYGPRYGYSSFPAYYPSYGYYSGYGDGYPYYGSGYYGSGRSAATNGLLLGALAGGIIGHNSGDFRHNGWRGAAWGAGAGWLLGTIADANRRPAYQSAPMVVQASPQLQTVQAQPAAPQPAPQQVTIINNYYGTPMSGANSLFGR